MLKHVPSVAGRRLILRKLGGLIAPQAAKVERGDVRPAPDVLAKCDRPLPQIWRALEDADRRALLACWIRLATGNPAAVMKHTPGPNVVRRWAKRAHLAELAETNR